MIPFVSFDLRNAVNKILAQRDTRVDLVVEELEVAD